MPDRDDDGVPVPAGYGPARRPDAPQTWPWFLLIGAILVLWPVAMFLLFGRT